MRELLDSSAAQDVGGAFLFDLHNTLLECMKGLVILTRLEQRVVRQKCTKPGQRLADNNSQKKICRKCFASSYLFPGLLARRNNIRRPDFSRHFYVNCYRLKIL